MNAPVQKKRKLMKFDSLVIFLTIIYVFLVICAVAFKELVYNELIAFLGERKRTFKGFAYKIGGWLGS